MDKWLDKLWQLLYVNLDISCPVLSGNMKNTINVTGLEENEIKIAIEPKFYNLKKFKDEGIIVFDETGKGNLTSYAKLVNDAGGFGTHNDSEHWVNRACYEVANAIKKEIESVEKDVSVVVVNELEL